jgi:hypothetical protein
MAQLRSHGVSEGKGVLGVPERLTKLLEIRAALPEIEASGDQHVAFRVRKKTFACDLDDHQGDGIESFCCESTLERQAELVRLFPGRYYVPDYVGPKSGVGLRLDLLEVNWEEVAGLAFSAFMLQAPRRLIDQFDAPSSFPDTRGSRL